MCGNKGILCLYNSQIKFMRHKNPYCLVEDNGFEPFAQACKASVLAKYTNPPIVYFAVFKILRIIQLCFCIASTRSAIKLAIPCWLSPVATANVALR